MSRIRLTDPDSIRCFLTTMVVSSGRLRITKAGKVSITGDARVDGSAYPGFLKRYNQLRLNKPELPELPATFDYFPVHFQTVSQVFSIEDAAYLQDFEGVPPVTGLFVAKNLPNVGTFHGAPKAGRYVLRNMTLIATTGLAATESVLLDHCRVVAFEDMPATVRVLSILGANPMPQGKALENITKFIIQKRNSVAVNWNLIPNLNELVADTSIPQPDSATLRRWLTTPHFNFTSIQPAPTFKPSFSGIPIPPPDSAPALPLWQQLLDHVTKFPGDMLSIVSGFQELYGESLFQNESVAAPDLSASAFDTPLM